MPAANDDRPTEVSTRRPPRSNGPVVAVRRRPRAHDPRFDTAAGRVNPNAGKHHYGFIGDMITQEVAALRAKLNRLRREEARRAREAAGESGSESSSSADDASDDDGTGDFEAREADRIRIGLLPGSALRREAQYVRQQLVELNGRATSSKAQSRTAQARRQLMKDEVAAVKAGKKQRVFFQKRGDVKRTVAGQKFDELKAAGGAAAVNRYVERKEKRAVRGTR